MTTNFQTARDLGLVTISASHVDISSLLKTNAEELLAGMPVEAIEKVVGISKYMQTKEPKSVEVSRELRSLSEVLSIRSHKGHKRDLPNEVLEMFPADTNFFGATYSVIIRWGYKGNIGHTSLGDWTENWQVVHRPNGGFCHVVLPFSTLLGETL